ncbi:MAG: hypothetical protein SPL61_11090 [Saccharofermentans sp.]|nr:hypothetical protein [Saccharofermentans sp.]
MWDFVAGFLKICWMILQLLFTLAKGLMGLGALSNFAIRQAAHNIVVSIVAWVTSLLLLSPFSDVWLGGAGSIEQSSVTKDSALSGLQTAFGSVGMKNLPVIAIEAGLALTMIAFFYGFAESSVQLEKTNMQLILSRILRWIIAVGLVTICYRLFAYLFMAFRSFYSIGGYLSEGSSYDTIKTWYESGSGGGLNYIIPPSYDDLDTSALIDSSSIMSSEMSEIPTLTGGAGASKLLSIRNGGVGCLIMFFGMVKLCKKAIKFVVEQVPAFIKVVVFFVFAPLGLAMYASPETQQKANSYLRQFGGVVLINLFKVIAISMATVLVCHLSFPVDGGSVCVLNTMPVVSKLVVEAFSMSSSPLGGGTTDLADIATDVAFLITSGGLLGYHLYFDLVGKASEISERFAHEVMA